MSFSYFPVLFINISSDSKGLARTPHSTFSCIRCNLKIDTCSFHVCSVFRFHCKFKPSLIAYLPPSLYGALMHVLDQALCAIPSLITCPAPLWTQLSAGLGLWFRLKMAQAAVVLQQQHNSRNRWAYHIMKSLARCKRIKFQLGNSLYSSLNAINFHYSFFAVLCSTNFPFSFKLSFHAIDQVQLCSWFFKPNTNHKQSRPVPVLAPVPIPPSLVDIPLCLLGLAFCSVCHSQQGQEQQVKHETHTGECPEARREKKG